MRFWCVLPDIPTLQQSECAPALTRIGVSTIGWRDITEGSLMQTKITTPLVKSVAPQTTPYEIFDTELTGFILRVQPSGHMSYYLAYRTPDGHRNRLRLGHADALSVAQARDLALKYAARVVGGEDVQATKQKAREQVHNAKMQTLSGFLEHKYG